MNKIIGLVITALVSVIVLAVVLIPVINDATATEDTFTNDGYYEMTYNEADEVTILWEYATPYQLKVNDEVVPVDASNFSSSMRKTILIGDDFILRTNQSYIGGVSYPLLQFNSSTSGSIFAGAVPNDEKDMTIVCSNGSYTVTAGNATATGTYTYLYTLSNDGEYVMKNSDGSAYMNADSEFIAMGTSGIDGQDVGIKITGSIDDGATVTTWKATDTWTFSNIVINYTAADGHKDLYKLTTITADAADDNSHSGSITYSYFLVPTEITAEKAQHLSPAEIEILDIIPVFIIIAVLIAAVAVVAFRRE